MTRTSPRLVAVVALGAVTMALAGCDGGAATAEGATAPAWDGKQIASAVIALPAQTSSFDPTASVSATDRVTASLMNTSLFIPKSDGTVEPGLALGTEFNDDYTQATVKLRPAKFSDGSGITAKDVAATVQRDMSVKDSVIASMTDIIASVAAVDDSTVKFTFDSPYPSFEGVAGQLSIYPAAAMADAATYFKAPTVTSGQYTIKQAWASNKLELEANPHYWGGQPAVKHVTFSVIADGNSALSQLQSGQVDFAGDLAPSYIKQVDGTSGLRVVMSDVFGFFDVRMQNSHAPFNDVNVRKAVSAALDREAIVNSIWGRYNTPQSGFWPKGMAGYDGSKPVKQDLDAAKNYLKGTSCESGCTVKMIYSDQDFAFSAQLALMLQAQLRKIGMTVDLEKLDGATLVDRLFAGTYDLCPGAMASTGNTPDDLLSNAVLGTGFLKSEFTGYDSAKMNDFVKQTIASTGDERKKAEAAVEAQFSADQPFATLAPWVRGSATRLPDGVFSLVGAAARMASVK